MTSDNRIAYVATSSAAISEHVRMIAELGEKRRRALSSLVNEGVTITEIADATGVNRALLYKASRHKPADASSAVHS